MVWLKALPFGQASPRSTVFPTVPRVNLVPLSVRAYCMEWNVGERAVNSAACADASLA